MPLHEIQLLASLELFRYKVC